jgi:glycine oxidase
METKLRARVAVAGAGAIGSAVALTLARAGFDVTLFDPNPPGDNASGVAAGMLAPVAEAVFDPVSTPHLALLRRARDRWPAFAEGLDLEILRDGLRVEGEAAWLAASPPASKPWASPSSAWTGPWSTPRTGGSRRGRPWPPCGPRSRPWAGVSRPAPSSPTTCGLLRRRPGHRRGRRGRPGAGAGGAQPDQGPDPARRPRSGDRTGDPGRGGLRLPRRAARRSAPPWRRAATTWPSIRRRRTPCARRPIRLRPELAHAVLTTEVGVRAATPDGLPLVGWSATPGVMLAVGARRNGWLLAPLVADLVAAYLKGDNPGPDAAPLDARRFSRT